MTAPLILGFDTSGPWCAAALWADDAIIEAVGENMTRGQAERLMGLLQELLTRHKLGWSDLDALGVGVGPGNFTGIRIGVSAARGLALGRGIPAYGIDGFDQRALVLGPGSMVCVPAPRDHVYVRESGKPSLAPRPKNVPVEPAPAALASAVAVLAAQRFPDAVPAPAPLYIRPPDAAPARDSGPVILPDG